MDSELSAFKILVEKQITKSRDAVLLLPLNTDPWASPHLEMDGQGTKRSGSCRSSKRDEAFGLLLLINAASDRQPGNIVHAVECMELHGVLYCFHKTVSCLFWDGGNQGLTFRTPDYAIKSGFLTVHYHANQSRTRQDSPPLLTSHLGNRATVFSLFSGSNIFCSLLMCPSSR